MARNNMRLNNLYGLIFLLFVSYVTSARILGIVHIPAPSHQQLGSKILLELAARGHDVTFITPMPKENYKSMKIIKLEYPERKSEEKLNMFDIQNKLALTQILFMDLLGVKICELALNSTAIQQFLSIKQHFDLIIMEEFLNQAFRGFCYRFNAHCISLSTVGLNRWSSTPMGNPRNPSYIPDLFVKFPSKMDFYQRFVNSFVDIAAILFGELYTLRKQNELLQKYFPGAPHLSDLYYNTSLMLLNSHVGVNAPVSLLPNVIPIGGYYIDPPKKLPTDLQEYLDNATRGAIYFSMGSNLRSSEMDSDKLDAILKVFSKLPYDILWKWENDTLPIQLSNVKISSWFPQGDILAHPNVKLFITHGGLLSTTETLYHGVPIVGIPIYGDQEMNIANAVQEGYALHLPYKELNEVKFAWAINEILNNTKYLHNVQRRSKILHDEPIKPLEKTMFWIEYVLRHDGAPHLRTAALDLTWYQYLLLDVILIAVFIILVALFIIYKILYICMRKVLRKGDKKEKIN